MASLLGASLGAQAADVFVPGAAKVEVWLQNMVEGNPAELNPAHLDDAALLPLLPTWAVSEQGFITGTFNTRSFYPNDSHENYLMRITGAIVVPTSGNYHFFLRADDDARFYLNRTGSASPDVTSGSEVPLIKEDIDCCDGWIAPGVDDDGDGFGDGDAEATTVTPVALVAGTQYGFTYLLKEGGGGDWGELDVRKSDDNRPNAPLAGSWFGVLAPQVAITTQPANLSTSENFPATLSVAVNTIAGVTYQWQANQVNIAGATGASYTFTPTQADNGKKYRVVVTQAGASINSNEATLTVQNDTTAPTITGVGTFLDKNGIAVYFSEPIGSGLAVAGNYGISGGVTVNSATALGESGVFLGTSALAPGASLTVTVNNVRDKATGGGNLVTPNTRAFTGYGANPAGTALSGVGYERFEATSDWAAFQTKLTDGTAADVSALRTGMEAPVDVADTHGTRLRTFFYPPKTGSYVFYGHSDDRGAFYLSTDSNPENKKLVAAEPTWNGNRAWTTLDRRDGAAPENRSSTYTGNEWPTKNQIWLVAGQAYYAEVQFLEGGGGDNGGMNFSIVGDPAFAQPAEGTRTRMEGSAVKWFGNNADFQTEVFLPSSQVFKRGDTLTLAATVSGPDAAQTTFQWYRNKLMIPGATSKTLVIPNAGIQAMGDYQLEATPPGADVIILGNGAADDNSRAYMADPTMIIEAEDYNYEGGKHIAAASSVSYRGGAYQGLKIVGDIDGFHDGDNSGGAAFSYQRAVATDAVVIEDKGIGDGVNNALGRDRGSFTMDVNYALGWTTVAEWQNYTRVFPKGNYLVSGAMSHDTSTGRGTLDNAADFEVDMILHKVANPKIADGSSNVDGTITMGGAQGLTRLGKFHSPGTGAWSSNDLVPLTDDNFNPVTIALEGETTLRLEFNRADGDADWIAFYCIDCTATVNPTISIAKVAGAPQITYTGVLQSATVVTGPYTDVAGATSPHSPTGASRFYRSKQ